jgi:DNA-directed RNA polymerase specialized sigma24 family protein
MSDREIINLKSRSEWLEAIMQWVHNETDRELLRRRLLDGIHFEPLAEEFNISVVHCKMRVKKAKEQLFKHI